MSERRIEKVFVENIGIVNRIRTLNESAIAPLMASMSKIGLRTPITVRLVGDEENPDVVLATGLHRLEAAKRLGWEEIECFVVDHEDDDHARMWEISENLHRAELSALERDQQIAEWVRLSDKLAQSAQVCTGGRGKEGGVSKASRELGLDRDDARRAVKVDSLADDAKDAAREVGLDDNRSALLQAAKAPQEQQAQTIRDIAKSMATRIDGDVKNRAAKECASIISEYVPADAWDGLKANLFAAGAKNIAVELTNMLGQSIMDRRYGQ